ncbi:hypothetical protein FHS22_005167 [Planomonospora venezuelensis]|uniref:Uncharacterized protein n=1 Tax=Planomonospora venezuelensis TaxID=1999 RepID=A0A841DAX8_PLAVE|nr:hypothetical protein [Planomonospora venezuelensis]
MHPPQPGIRPHHPDTIPDPLTTRSGNRTRKTRRTEEDDHRIGR